MLLRASLNGARLPGDHPALPLDQDACVEAAVACVKAGADAIHLHPRDAGGFETLEPNTVDHAVMAVRHAADVPVGVSTGAWIEPDLSKRVALVHRWADSDFVSVNLREEGAREVMAALIDHDIPIEAGIASPEDVMRLVDGRMAEDVVRVLIEPPDERAADALATAAAIEAALDAAGVDVPRLAHGSGVATWSVIEWAVSRGYDIGIGLEDTLVMPDGRDAGDNASLCEAAAHALPA